MVLPYVDGQVGDQGGVLGAVGQRSRPQSSTDPVHHLNGVALDGGSDPPGQYLVIAAEVTIDLGRGVGQGGAVLL